MEQQGQQPSVLGERKKIKAMVAIDESDESLYALKWALENLIGISGGVADPTQEQGNLTLVHVQQPFQHYIFPSGPAVYATSSVVESIKKAQEEHSAVVLSQALQVCKGNTVKVETMAVEGDPKEVICQTAERMHVDLVVLGSRGLGKIKRAFLGSVSDYCAHHCKCPVLIVRPPKEASK